MFLLSNQNKKKHIKKYKNLIIKINKTLLEQPLGGELSALEKSLYKNIRESRTNIVHTVKRTTNVALQVVSV